MGLEVKEGLEARRLDSTYKLKFKGCVRKKRSLSI